MNILIGFIVVLLIITQFILLRKIHKLEKKNMEYISPSRIMPSSITSFHVAAGSITGNQIASGTITGNHLAKVS